MKKAYIYHIISAFALLATVEAYFWTQSRTLTYANSTMKAALIAVYFIVAIASQAAISSVLRLEVRDTLKANVLLAAIVSVGLTLLAIFVHQGLAHDLPPDWSSLAVMSLKFLMTIGFATLLLRVIVAVFSARLQKP